MIYDRRMKTINRLDTAFTVETAGVAVKVFRAGTSFALAGRGVEASSPEALRGVHSHFAYEVFFAAQGSLTLVTGEGGTVYERKTVIVPPGLRHYSAPQGEGSYCLLFRFEASRTPERIAALEARLNAQITVLPLAEDAAFYIREMARRSEEGDSAAQEDTQRLAALVFSGLLRLLLPENAQHGTLPHSARHMHEIEYFINSNLARRITLSDVAAHVYLSPRQVSRIVRQECGCTVAELVMEKKLAAAEMLVRNTDMKISAIAQQVNLGAEHYFYACFRRRYGQSPLQYRKRLFSEPPAAK